MSLRVSPGTRRRGRLSAVELTLNVGQHALMQRDDPVARAWSRAGDDLGIVVVAPAVVTVGATTVHACALVPQFGAPKGMVVFHEVAAHTGTPEHGAALEELLRGGYGFTHMD